MKFLDVIFGSVYRNKIAKLTEKNKELQQQINLCNEDINTLKDALQRLINAQESLVAAARRLKDENDEFRKQMIKEINRNKQGGFMQ